MSIPLPATSDAINIFFDPFLNSFKASFLFDWTRPPWSIMVEILFFGQALNSETYLIGTLIIVVSILVSLRK